MTGGLTVESAFAEAMREAGIEPPSAIYADGNLHRFDLPGERGRKSGAYLLHGDRPPNGWFQSHKGIDGLKRWLPGAVVRTIDGEGMRTIRRERAERKRARDEARAVAQRRAHDILAAATGDPVEHPYWKRKGVDLGPLVKRGSWPQNDWDDALLVPLYDGEGRLASVEAINVDGRKRFLKDGQTAGCFYPFGKLRGASSVLVGEGVATVAAGVEATGCSGIAAMSAGNLLAAARTAVRLAPDAVLVVIADNDIKEGDGNPGLEAAYAAAHAVGGVVVTPELNGDACDLWDLRAAAGTRTVRALIEAALPGAAKADERRSGALAADRQEAQSPALPKVETGVRDDIEVIAQATEAGDAGAPFEPSALTLMRALKQDHPAEWQRLRQRLKSAGTGLTELERRLQRGSATHKDDDPSVADRLIALARSRCALLHDAQREPVAVFEANGARQVHAVLSRGFSDFLSHAYYTEHDRAPADASLKVALATLRGQAQFDGASCEVFTRIARTDAGYWIDLCNDAWECVLVTAEGWSVVTGEGAPLFTRSASMRPLPMPARGGTLEMLWPLINIPVADRGMVLAWLLECMRADTPHLVLELVGEQGSAKSSTQRALRRLVDPNQADLRAAPKSVEDLWIAARNSHMVSLENLSHLQPQYQDALCVLATGGGYSARTLYTNAEETIIELRKPIMVNGISVIVTAQDLLDRTVHIDLPTIEHRETSGEIGYSGAT
ncbi:MAG: hypothetical protein INH00_18315 [Rhodocyclaceae bacterium]|nr:hypothetical protein [Rhodocyclaceae bacterium]